MFELSFFSNEKKPITIKNWRTRLNAPSHVFIYETDDLIVKSLHPCILPKRFYFIIHNNNYLFIHRKMIWKHSTIIIPTMKWTKWPRKIGKNSVNWKENNNINIILGLSSSQTINTLSLLAYYTVVKSITLHVLANGWKYCKPCLAFT